MELTELLKVYGPLSLGWIIAGYLMKFILDRYDSDLKAKSDLAQALHQLAEAVKDRK